MMEVQKYYPRHFALLKIVLSICLFLAGSDPAEAQKPVRLNGNIVDAIDHKPVPFASIRIKGTGAGASADENGQFKLLLSTSAQDSISLEASCLGYTTQEYRVSLSSVSLVLSLLPSEDKLTEVVYSATRISQHILRSPVSIEKLNARSIRQSPALTYYDALPSLKGVEAVTSGLTYKQINTRGFNSTGNQRFLQLIDGVDNQGPGLNFSIGNFMGVSDLDVESVEIIPGAASALYGPIAFNGLMQVRTRDPFEYKGFSFQYKTGINHVRDPLASPHGLNDVALRYAGTIGKKFAYKFNAGYFTGFDWIAGDYTDISAATPVPFRGPANPGRDALNIYGDEVYRSIAGIGLVSRTGYAEKDLMDYDAYSAKWNASLHYRFNDKVTLSYQYRFGQGTAAYTGSSRYSLNDYRLRTHVLELKSPRFLWRSYYVSERSGNTYNSRSLGQFINRQWVQDLSGQTVAPSLADATWFARYEAAYKGNVPDVIAADHSSARAFADEGRLLPGSELFSAAKERIIHQYGTKGSGVFTECGLWHSEGQYDLSHWVGNQLELLAGGSIRLYDMFTNGSLFDDKDKKLTMLETGLFLQASRSFFEKKLLLTGSVRYDKNENFKGSLTPRIAAVFHPGGTHHFRASYQTGFRNPTTVDLFIKLNVGPITILGGAPENSKGLNVYENSFTAASVAAFIGAFNKAMASGGTSYEQALATTKELLKKSAVKYILPEQLQAFELGYKGYLVPGFLLDANVYWTTYSQFILNTVVQRPQQPVLNADGSVNSAAALDLLNGKGQAFQLYTNSAARVSSWGYSLGLDWNVRKGFNLGGNLTAARISNNSDPNNVVDFNTAPYSSNLYMKYQGEHLFGMQVNWHWQDAFDWYGTFNGKRPGRINAYSLVDLQVSRVVPRWHTTIKIGGSNILNHRVVQAYGSPSVGAIYYCSFLFEK